MTLFPRIFSFFALVSFSTLAATEGLHVVYDLELNRTGKEKETMKSRVEYYVLPGQIRFENQTSENPMGTMVVISKSNPRKAYMLFTKEKTYMEIPDMNLKSAEREAARTEPFKPTGKKKEIVGYSCEVLTRDLSDRTEEACTSSKLAKEYKYLQDALPKSKDGQNTLPKGMEGFPLEYKTTPKSKDQPSVMGETRMLVSEIQKAPLSALLFEIPADYKKKEFPSINAEKLSDPKKKGKEGVAPEVEMPKDLQERLKNMQQMMEEMKKKK